MIQPRDNMLQQKTIVIVTDAGVTTDTYRPAMNGVVRTWDTVSKILAERGYKLTIITPQQFHTKPFPPYPKIQLAKPFHPKKGEKTVWRTLRDTKPDYIHNATPEGPLGFLTWVYCARNREKFSMSYHTRMPEYAEEYVRDIAERLTRRVPFSSTIEKLAARLVGEEGRRVIPEYADYYVRGLAERLTGRVPFSSTIKNLTSRIAREGAHMFLSQIYSQAESVLVPTKTLQGELKARNYRKTTIWPRGVDTQLFSPDYPMLPEVAKLKPPIFLYVGRVAKEKNIGVFLDAKLPGTKVVVGGGPELDYFISKYADRANIVFVGEKLDEELSRFYASCAQMRAVFAFPSLTDTYGNTILEAWASGLIVAAFNVPSPIDVIIDPKTGVLTADITPEGFANALMAARQLDGGYARDYVKQNLTWDKVVDILEKHFVPTIRTRSR